MKHLAWLACAVMAASCASGPPAVRAPGLPLQNAGFEEAGDACPPGWTCIVHNGVRSHGLRYDDRAPGAGRLALCADPLQPKDNWFFLYQRFPAEKLRGARVRLSALVRNAGDPGTGAGPSLLAQGIDDAMIVHEQRLAPDTGGWKRLAAEITVPANAFHLQAGILFESHAPACVDDVYLEILAPGPGAV